MENKPCQKCGQPANSEIEGYSYCAACIYEATAESEKEKTDDDEDCTPDRPE